MAILRLLFVAALVALPLWVASTMPAHACNFTYGTAVPASDVIVIGTPTEVRLVPTDPDEWYGVAEVTFSAQTYLAGSGADEIIINYPTAHVSTAANIKGKHCDEPLMPGGEVIALLRKDDESRYSIVDTTYFTGVRDWAVSQIRAILAAEQVGLPPTGSDPSSHSDTHLPLIAASALAAVGLAANAAYAVQRRG
jgi:hypothetical protein